MMQEEFNPQKSCFDDNLEKSKKQINFQNDIQTQNVEDSQNFNNNDTIDNTTNDKINVQSVGLTEIDQKKIKSKSFENNYSDDELSNASDKQQKQIREKSQQKQMINVLSLVQVSEPIDKKNLKADSLQYDIKLGWIPKTQITGPIPISFSHTFLDQLVQQKIDQQKVVYLGSRPTNTFQVHKKYYQQGKKYPFYQFHLCKSQFLERFFKKYYSDYQFDSKRKVGMLEQVSIQSEITNKNSLQFNSQYQGGNLDAVYYEEDEHRLFVRVDSNTKGHCNYYNFKVKCLKSGTYKFRIMNMSKKKSLYQRGMKPYIKVTNIKTQQSDNWAQRDQSQCMNVKFGLSPLNEGLQSEDVFYSLKFDLILKNQHQYQICYGIPYVYSELISMLNQLRQNKNLHVGKLCYSLSGIQIPLLTISQGQQKQSQDKQEDKQTNNNYYVVITGRIHPAETNGSHIVNGMIKNLLKNIDQIKKLRKNVVFKIIPMLNPDGVIVGNTRTGFAGKDLNRKFTSGSDFIFPEVNNLRDYVVKLKEKHGKRLLFLIDIHGHSTRKGSFFFGPEYPVLDQEYSKCRLLPRLYSCRAEAFRYYSCKFKISSYKQTTSRGYFNSRGIRTYTHQTSMHSYFDFKSRKDLAFTKKTLQNLGKQLVLAIYDYVERLKNYIAPIRSLNKGSSLKNEKQINPIKQILENVTISGQDQQRDSDKMLSDKADSQSSDDDLQDKSLSLFYEKINQNREYFYQEILKNMNNSKDSLNQASFRNKRNKNKQSDKQKKQKEKQKQKQLLKQLQKKKQRINWASKASYTPKKTLFQQYSKLSSVILGKGPNYRATNSLIPKIKLSNQLSSKRYEYEKNQDNYLTNFTKTRMENNRIIYSVPNIKWDQSLASTVNSFKFQQIQRSKNEQIYKIDMRRQSPQNRVKKRQKTVSNFQNFQQKQSKLLKINKDMLQKLLIPSSSIFESNQPKFDYGSTSFKDYRRKTNLAEQKNSGFSNNRRSSIISSFKHDYEINAAQQSKNQTIQNGPQIETQKEEYLCKKWQKQIICKIKKNNSFSTTLISLDSKISQTDNKIYTVNKNNQIFNRQSLKTIMTDQKSTNRNVQWMKKSTEKGFYNNRKQQPLPKIYLNRNQVLVIKNDLQSKKNG